MDVVAVAKKASALPNVFYSTHEMFMCSDSGQKLIREKIMEHRLNRVVVASCSPRMHEVTFRRVVEEAGLNRYLFEQVNLREHVSWCHMHMPEEATDKANDLVRMSVARAANLTSLDIKCTQVIPKTLIVGGGIAGLTAALDISKRGFEVILLEKRPALGGHLIRWSHLYPTDESGPEVIELLIKQVQSRKSIEVLLNSEVIEVEGYIGNFRVKTLNNNNGLEKELIVGSVIIATGFEVFRPFGYYAYGKSPDIITLADLQEIPPSREILRQSDGIPVQKIAFIGCVGSREPGVLGHEHCSRHCCFATAKAAADLSSKINEIVILYKSLRTYGKHHEEIHRLARSRHVIYSRFDVNDPPDVQVIDGRIRIVWKDILADEELEYEPDMLVLATAMIAPKDADNTAKLFGLSRSSDGFFSPEHVKLAPLTTHSAGIMIAGTSQAAKNASESAIDASGAAAKCVGLMAKGEVEIDSAIAFVDSNRCSGCMICKGTCPYNAIEVDDSFKPPVARVIDAKCHGCGTCAAACPIRAIIMQHSTDIQIMSMIEAYLQPELVQERFKQ